MRLQPVVQILIFGRDRLLGAESVNCSSQTQRRVQEELLAHDAVDVYVDVLDVELALVALVTPFATGVGPTLVGGCS